MLISSLGTGPALGASSPGRELTPDCERFVSISNEWTNNDCADLCVTTPECIFQRPIPGDCYSSWLHGVTLEDLDTDPVIEAEGLHPRSTPQECQALCQQSTDCDRFVFSVEDRVCRLLPGESAYTASILALSLPKDFECLQDVHCEDRSQCKADIVDKCFHYPDLCRSVSGKPTCVHWDQRVISGPRLCGENAWLADMETAPPGVTPFGSKARHAPQGTPASPDEALKGIATPNTLGMPIEQLECCDNDRFTNLGLSCTELSGMCASSPIVRANCPMTCGGVQNPSECQLYCSRTDQRATSYLESAIEECFDQIDVQGGHRAFCRELCQHAIRGEYWSCSSDNATHAAECIGATFPSICPLHISIVKKVLHVQELVESETTQASTEGTGTSDKDPNLGVAIGAAAGGITVVLASMTACYTNRGRFTKGGNKSDGEFRTVEKVSLRRTKSKKIKWGNYGVDDQFNGSEIGAAVTIDVDPSLYA